MRKSHFLFLMPVLAFPLSGRASEALAPQLDFSGTGIVTLMGRTPDPKPSLNFSDSSLSVQASQAMFAPGAIGSFRLGVLAPDAANTSSGASLFLHEANARYETERTEWQLGRMASPASRLIDLPTLREEDLLEFRQPLNPFGRTESTEEHQYANSASFTLNQKLTWFQTLYVQNRLGSDSRINTVGASLKYLAAPGMEPLERWVSAGLDYEHTFAGQGLTTALEQLSANAAINLVPSMTERWELRTVATLNLGSQLTRFARQTDTYRARYHALLAALRYLPQPYGQGGAELALTAGMRSYWDVAQARDQGFALLAAKSLGAGFDLAAQFKGEWRSSALNAFHDGHVFESTGELGLIYRFDAALNSHLNPRRSYLNSRYTDVPQ